MVASSIVAAFFLAQVLTSSPINVDPEMYEIVETTEVTEAVFISANMNDYNAQEKEQFNFEDDSFMSKFNEIPARFTSMNEEPQLDDYEFDEFISSELRFDDGSFESEALDELVD